MLVGCRVISERDWIPQACRLVPSCVTITKLVVLLLIRYLAQAYWHPRSMSEVCEAYLVWRLQLEDLICGHDLEQRFAEQNRPQLEWARSHNQWSAKEVQWHPVICDYCAPRVKDEQLDCVLA